MKTLKQFFAARAVTEEAKTMTTKEHARIAAELKAKAKAADEKFHRANSARHEARKAVEDHYYNHPNPSIRKKRLESRKSKMNSGWGNYQEPGRSSPVPDGKW